MLGSNDLAMTKRKLRKKIKRLKDYLFYLEQLPVLPMLVSPSLEKALKKAKSKLK